ncbi:MAG: methyltransferase domain-containing protein, partial [Pyrinomonadaceae bacterium]
AVSGVLQSKSGGATLLDVGAGSGAVLRHLTSRYSFDSLVGLDNHPQSAKRISTEKANSAIDAVQGDAFTLPFADNAFDIVICSLFLHHLTDSQIVQTLAEMRRVAKQAVIGIDLKRSPWAYWSYRAFCASFRISELVTHDGSLSIMKSFSRDELLEFGKAAGLESPRVESVFPFRWVLIG